VEKATAEDFKKAILILHKST
jgi:hypothetical protein